MANELYSDETEQRDFSIELMKLNPTYSTVLYLFYYEGYKAEEIAKMLSKTTASVNMILSRARKQLKERLKEDNRYRQLCSRTDYHSVQISKAAQNGKQNRGNRFGKRRSSGYWHFFCISVPFNGSRLCFGKIIAII